MTIGPEPGLETGGQRFVIKLMESSLQPQLTNGELVAVLDARRGRLLLPSGKVAKNVLDGLLLGEFASIAALWLFNDN